jgi:hypothetical protein
MKGNLFGENALLKCAKKETIKEEYEQFLKDAKLVKEYTKGLIDYAECGFSHKQASQKLFHNMSRGIEDPEPLTELEEEWIKDSFMGSLIFGEKKELDNAICYDNNCAYGNVLQKSCFKIPVKAGDFTQIKELPEILPFGIYRVIIKKSNTWNNDKLFRFNTNNKYTHTDIYVARKLGLSIELIQDGQANSLTYGAGKCVTASKMFGTLIEYLYKMKLDKIPFAKHMITRLWGGLCEKNAIYKVVKDESSNPYEIPADCKIIGIKPTGKGDLITYAKRGRYFKLNYARFAPFLTAYVRKIMADTIYPHREYVYRCHTDSILSSKPITELKLSPFIGDFKIEHEGKCIIKNSMDVEWFEK